MKQIIIIVSIFMTACQSRQENNVTHLDSLYFGNYNRVQFDSAVAPFLIQNLNGIAIARLYADSVYEVKVDVGRLTNLDPKLFSF